MPLTVDLILKLIKLRPIDIILIIIPPLFNLFLHLFLKCLYLLLQFLYTQAVLINLDLLLPDSFLQHLCARMLVILEIPVDLACFTLDLRVKAVLLEMSLVLVFFKRFTAVDHWAGESDIRTFLGEMGFNEVLIGE
jgi:hypothetical protein